MKRSVSSTMHQFQMDVADSSPFGSPSAPPGASAHHGCGLLHLASALWLPYARPVDAWITNAARYSYLQQIRAVRDRSLLWVVAIVFTLAVIVASPSHAEAARVGGVLTGYENSTPQASRDLHFQNIITGDIYLSPTHSDGSFRASLPPGTYRLRTETGAVLVNSIVVHRADIDLGRVNELAPLAPQRLWQSQSIAPASLAGPAPSTAYLMTSDTTPLPATATTMPKPQIDWSRPPPETQASQGPNSVTGMSTAPLPPPHAPSPAMPAAPGGMGAAPYSSAPAMAGTSPLIP
jgi:hypothetical protein